MEIRSYAPSDIREMAALFYDTVHTVNARDYTPAQLDAWATGEVDLAAWDQSFQEHTSLVAEENGVIVGFGDMDETGYLDRLYVHEKLPGTRDRHGPVRRPGGGGQHPADHRPRLHHRPPLL